MKIEVSARARADLASALEFLAARNPGAALRAREAVRTAILSLRTFPNRGRVSLLDGFRELLVPGFSYAIVYRVSTDSVRIMRIRHTSQDPSP